MREKLGKERRGERWKVRERREEVDGVWGKGIGEDQDERKNTRKKNEKEWLTAAEPGKEDVWGDWRKGKERRWLGWPKNEMKKEVEKWWTN